MSRFIETTAEGVTVLRSPLFTGLGVAHGFSTRLGGVSEGPYASLNLRLSCPDDPANVRENLRRLGAAVGFSPNRCAMTKQVHGREVRCITADEAAYSPRQDCDGVTTDLRGHALMSFGADCVTILLCDPERRCGAAVHAGWRGAVAGTLTAAAERLCADYGTSTERLYAAIGPAISGERYEVDTAVAEALREAHGLTDEEARILLPKRGEKYYPDLRAFAALRLRRAGLPADQIDVDDHCTWSEPDLFWSHRRTGDARGVQAAVLML